MNYVKSLSLAVCLLVVPAMQASGGKSAKGGTGRLSAAYSWVAESFVGKKVGGVKNFVTSHPYYVGAAAVVGTAVYAGQKYNKNFRDTYFTPAVAKVVAYKNALLSREVNREKVGTGVVLALAGAYVYRNEIGGAATSGIRKYVKSDFRKTQDELDEEARVARVARLAQAKLDRIAKIRGQLDTRQDDKGVELDDDAVDALQRELDALNK